MKNPNARFPVMELKVEGIFCGCLLHACYAEYKELVHSCVVDTYPDERIWSQVADLLERNGYETTDEGEGKIRIHWNPGHPPKPGTILPWTRSVLRKARLDMVWS
jgi:hypothetical protein